MASAVAKRRDRRASRSASWSVMHSDEELARILQMQEEKDYQDHLAAKEKQCKNDHKLARFLSEHDGRQEIEIDVDTSQGGRRPANTRSMLQSHSTGALAGTSSQNTTLVSLTDSDADFSDCFEDPTFNELASVLEVARNEADHLAERQDEADMLARDGEIAAALQNDEQLNGILENELELSGSTGEVGTASFNPIVVSPSGPESEPMEFGAAFVDIDDGGDWTSENETPGTSPTNSSLLTSVNMAWNVVGSAVNWVSELFSGVPSLPPESSVGDRARTRRAGDAEEDDDDDDEEEDCCEEDDGWEDEDSDDLDDFDDDEDDDEDDAFDLMESDVDDSDDDNVEMAVGFGGRPVGRGLVQEEINVLPTRTYQTRPTQTASTTTMGAAAAADAGANEHQCQNECQVCLSSFADGEVLRTLPCCHQFHSECIDVWLQRNAICPVCRVRIRDEIGCR